MRHGSPQKQQLCEKMIIAWREGRCGATRVAIRVIIRCRDISLAYLTGF